MSYRITVQEQAAPFALASAPQTTGAMVIRAPKGNAEPIRISRGGTSDIIRRFGYPSTQYPDIQEALDFIGDSDLWISAPHDTSEALYGGAFVTKNGTVPLTMGISSIDTLDFTSVPYKEEIGEGDDTTVNFTFVLTGGYKNNSLSQIVVGDTVIPVTVSDAEPEVITGAGINTGTLTRATYTIDVTFDAAPDDGDKVYAVYAVDYSDLAYFALTSKTPHLSDEEIKASYNADTEEFVFDFFIKNNRKVYDYVDTYRGSVDPEVFDRNFNSLYIETQLEGNPYLDVKVNLQTFDSFTPDATAVEFGGGIRATTFSSTDYTEGWEFFEQGRKYPAKIFMDVTGDPAIPAIFDDLRDNFQKFSRYLIVLPDNEVPATSITTKSGYSIDNRGLYFYSNWMERRENYTRTKLWSSLIGETAKAHAAIMRLAFGGLAPSWLNENGLGGQLSPSNALRMRYDYTEPQLRDLDEAGINARVFDPSYGVFIASQKTGQNPNVLTDFSYIAHSGCADYIIENIVKQVLPPQITKLNDDTHRSIVQGKSDAIIDPLLNVNGNVIINQFVNKCDGENNDASVLSRREFVLTTGVRFTPTSEFITFNFRSAPQGVDVQEIVG